MGKRGSYLGGSTIVGPASSWFSRNKSSRDERTNEQIEEDVARFKASKEKRKAIRRKIHARRSALKQAERAQQQAEHERKKAERKDRTKRQALQKDDPAYKALKAAQMKERRLKREEDRIKKLEFNKKSNSIKIMEKTKKGTRLVRVGLKTKNNLDSPNDDKND